MASATAPPHRFKCIGSAPITQPYHAKQNVIVDQAVRTGEVDKWKQDCVLDEGPAYSLRDLWRNEGYSEGVANGR